MPPKKLPTIWNAPPHTIAKIKMLRAYLVAWFQILGRSRRGQDLLYVDGFAGPGEYVNYPTGSPLAALSAAEEALALTASQWVGGKIHCAFIEADDDRYSISHRRLSRLGAEEILRLTAITMNSPQVCGRFAQTCRVRSRPNIHYSYSLIRSAQQEFRSRP